jgi:hypothetical protein
LNRALKKKKKQRINTYRSKNALKTTTVITKPKNGTQKNLWEGNGSRRAALADLPKLKKQKIKREIRGRCGFKKP